MWLWNRKPKCESPIEWRLYNALSRKGYKVKTQVRCGPFYIDMCIGNIAIECDGFAYHSSPDQKKYDRRRTSYLYRNGYKSVLRFTGSEINSNVNECVKRIEKKLAGQCKKYSQYDIMQH
jgi:very-short-patch-repair endonuclease